MMTPTAPNLDRPVEALDAMPGMGAAFARALVPSRAGAAVLPDRAVTVTGLRQDPAQFARYARVCGFTLRDHVPPTWLHVLTFPLHVFLLGDTASTIRLAGAVHVSNAMTVRRPVLAHEVLDVTVHAEGPRPHRRGALVTLVGSIGVAGEEVWRGESTYLAHGMSAAGELVEPDREPWQPITPQARWSLPGDLGRQYRSVSHDPNPIHTSRVAAKAFGFARPIIHGMWTHARAIAALEGRLDATYTANVDFVKPIVLPGTVGFGVTGTPLGYAADVTTRDGSKPHLRMRIEAPS